MEQTECNAQYKRMEFQEELSGMKGDKNIFEIQREEILDVTKACSAEKEKNSGKWLNFRARGLNQKLTMNLSKAQMSVSPCSGSFYEYLGSCIYDAVDFMFSFFQMLDRYVSEFWLNSKSKWWVFSFFFLFFFQQKCGHGHLENKVTQNRLIFKLELKIETICWSLDFIHNEGRDIKNKVGTQNTF